MNLNEFRRTTLALASALLFIPHAASGQPSDRYPDRPLRVIIPFAPGSASDFTARVMAPELTAELGKQIVVDNRTGAGGFIGLEIVARANPDGYTLLHSSVGAIAINPWVLTAVQPVRDLSAISLVVDVPSILVANPAFAPNTLKEVIEFARASPGKVHYSSGSVGLVVGSRLEMEAFLRTVGIKMTHIGYKGGAGQSVIGLMSNEVQMMFVSMPSVVNFVRQRRLKAYGVTSATRVSAVPDVPTMPELGYPSMKFGTWQGLFAPKGTPPAIVSRWLKAIHKVVDLPDVKRRLAEGGASTIVSRSPQEFADFVRAETERFGKTLKETPPDSSEPQ